MRSADPSLSAAERADAVCDEFEAAHRAGKAPRIDEYAARVPEGERAELRAALAAVEAELSGSAAVPLNVGRFEVRGELGAGAFGRVYRAWDPNLQREVAVKVPQPGALRTAADRDRFLKEARAAATISHPNVCPIHEIGEADGRPYIVMPLVPGHTLAAALKKRSEPLPEKQVALIVRKLALALDAAHKKGVIHRDLKPANVMFDRERNDLVVMDFGLARRADAETGAGDTQSGVIMGTPAYMSPEQARGGAKDVGPAADVFALGAMMYEMLTGHRPFSGGSANEVIGRILLMNPEPPSALRPGVSPALEAACLKALAKDPAARFASMREFATAVDTFLRAPTPAAETAVAVETVPMAAPVEAEPDGDVGLSTNTRKLADLFGALSEQQEAQRAETEEAIERAVAKARTPRWVFVTFGAVAVVAVVALVAGLMSGSRPVKVTLQLTGIDLSDKSLSFTLDGKPIPAEALAQPIDLKPGEHELIAYRGTKKVKRLIFTVTGGREPRVEYREPDEGDGPDSDGPSAPITGLEFVKTLPHKEYVGDVRFSADGSQLLTACPGTGDGKGGTEGAGVFAWNAKTWEPLGAVVEHPIVTKVLPVGGKLVVCVSGASGSFGRVPAEFIVWNPAKRARDLKFAVETCGGVRALDPLPNGTGYLASLHEGDQPRVAVFDLATGETRLKLTSAAGCVANDKDGKSIFAAFGAELRQIDIASEKVLRTLKGHTADVFFVTCSPDGRLAASCAAGKDNELILWNLTATDGAPVVLGKFKVPATCLAFSPNGKYMLSGSGEGILKLWDVTAQKEVASARADAQSLHAVRFSPDGAFAVTGGNADKAAKVWKLARGAAPPKGPKEPKDPEPVAEPPVSGNPLLRRWVGHTRRASGVWFFPDGKTVLSSQIAGARFDPTLGSSVFTWSPNSDKPLPGDLTPRRNERHDRAIVRAAFSRDGRFALYGCVDVTDTVLEHFGRPTLVSVERATGTILKDVDLSDREIVLTGADLSADGKFALVCPGDGTARVYSTADWKEARRAEGESGCFDPTGKWFLTAKGNDVYLWATTGDGPEARRMKGAQPVSRVCWSPAGRMALACGPKGATVWDAETGTEGVTFAGHTGAVTCGAFAPDGKRVVTGSEDKTARLWDAASGKELLRYEDHEAAVTGVAFSPGGGRVATSCLDARVRLWAVPVPKGP